MTAARKRFRVGLDGNNVCSKCLDVEEGVRVTYHVRRGPVSCQNGRMLSLIMDQDNTVTYMRLRPYCWVSLIAGLGGLWSVITGISLVTIMELVYWLSQTFYNHIEAVKDNEGVNVSQSENYSISDEQVSRPKTAWSDDIPEERSEDPNEESLDEEESEAKVVSKRPKSAWRGRK